MKERDKFNEEKFKRNVSAPILPKDAFKEAFPGKLTKTLSVGKDKTIEYDTIVPLQVTLKLTWRQKLSLVFGNSLITNLNTYLNNGRIVYTVIVVQTLKEVAKEYKNKVENSNKRY